MKKEIEQGQRYRLNYYQQVSMAEVLTADTGRMKILKHLPKNKTITWGIDHIILEGANILNEYWTLIPGQEKE